MKGAASAVVWLFEQSVNISSRCLSWFLAAEGDMSCELGKVRSKKGESLQLGGTAAGRGAGQSWLRAHELRCSESWRGLC